MEFHSKANDPSILSKTVKYEPQLLENQELSAGQRHLETKSYKSFHCQKTQVAVPLATNLYLILPPNYRITPCCLLSRAQRQRMSSSPSVARNCSGGRPSSFHPGSLLSTNLTCLHHCHVCFGEQQRGSKWVFELTSNIWLDNWNLETEMQI